MTWLPLPVAQLRRRAYNAKSSKDRHDTAYFAWEVSVRLAVAAAPPQDPSSLRRASVGEWVQALDAKDLRLDQKPVAELFSLMSDVGSGAQKRPAKVSGTELLAALPAYRNKVIGHGSPRPGSFYDSAGALLLEALDAAWEAELFLPRSGKMVFLETIAERADGKRLGRILDLTGETPLIIDPRGSELPQDVRSHRLYWREADAYRDLHPWLIFQEEGERLYCFNGLARRAEYLDYGSGDLLRGQELEGVRPGLEQELRILFSSPAPSEPESDEASESADRFGEFKILGRLGVGGMGEVYLAEQETLHRRVALKILPERSAQEPVSLARFRREVAALSRCEHPHVVKVLTSGEARGVPYYAMEYVDGADLSDVAKALSDTGDFDSAVSTACEAARGRQKELFAEAPPVEKAPIASRAGRGRFQELATYFRDAARGVAHLHEHGIIHRDLKPGNLMITANDRRAVVMDLGLAAVEDASVSLTMDKSQILGTLRYMPPEQLQRNLLSVDHRADVYALGATLYELVTDRPFFDGDTEARLIEQVLREQPLAIEKANLSVPKDLATIVRKASEKDPGLRYESAEALADDLEAFLENRPISARPPSLGYVFKMAVRRHKGLSAVIAASLVIIVVGTIIAFRQITAARDDAKLAATTAERERQKTADALEAKEDALQLAQRNEERATRNADEAKKNADTATRNADEAQQNLDELLQLSSIEILTDMRRRADEDLWPPGSATIPKMEAWIAEAETSVVPLLGPLMAQRDELEAEALPYTEEQSRRDRDTHPEAAVLAEARSKAKELEEQLAAAKKKSTGPAALLSGGGSASKEEAVRLGRELEAQQAEVDRLEGIVSERRTWEFAGDAKMDADAKRWRHRLVRSLVSDLGAFFEGPGSAYEAVRGYAGEAYGSSLPEVRTRLELARRLERETAQGDEAKRLWAAAIADIAQHSEYGGLALTVQEGLLPIGNDPDSTLWEFAVLSTGEVPERDGGGRIVVSDEMAVILVLIPGGELDMGAIRPSADRPEGSPNVDPQARSDESPVRRIALDPFFLSKYEMTQGQWERARAARPSYYDVNTPFARQAWRRHPVEQVSWPDCDEVLLRLGLILPSEAQWEYGARARTTTVWWPGNEEKELEGKANIADQSYRRAGGNQPPVPWDDGFPVHAPVGSFGANRFGLHDVHGNVWEWCLDGYGDYEIAFRAGDGLRSIDGARNRVFRGGSFSSPAVLARSANRYDNTPDYRVNALGVRPARVITD
ncbi:MAG: SUMF1/EgtB/PvdO family nonheme iron enzyme [Planctomycetota bacterium]